MSETKLSLRGYRGLSFHFIQQTAWCLDSEDTAKLNVYLARREDFSDNLKTDRQVHEAVKDRVKRNQISDELADILIYCLSFSDVLGIDVSGAIEAKLRKNVQKYPAMKT